VESEGVDIAITDMAKSVHECLSEGHALKQETRALVPCAAAASTCAAALAILKGQDRLGRFSEGQLPLPQPRTPACDISET
jgi:hypothetical protein